MTVYIIREGKIVEKTSMEEARADNRSIFPSPRVSKFQSYESPVTGARITSSRQREVDLFKADAYDARDLGPNHEFTRAKEARKAENAGQRPTQLDFWRDRD